MCEEGGGLGRGTGRVACVCCCAARGVGRQEAALLPRLNRVWSQAGLWLLQLLPTTHKAGSIMQKDLNRSRVPPTL